MSWHYCESLVNWTFYIGLCTRTSRVFVFLDCSIPWLKGCWRNAFLSSSSGKEGELLSSIDSSSNNSDVQLNSHCIIYWVELKLLCLVLNFCWYHFVWSICAAQAVRSSRPQHNDNWETGTGPNYRSMDDTAKGESSLAQFQNRDLKGLQVDVIDNHRVRMSEQQVRNHPLVTIEGFTALVDAMSYINPCSVDRIIGL